MATGNSGRSGARILLDPERYAILRRKLILFFASNRCADPENEADETVRRLWQKVTEGVEFREGPEHFAHGIARNVLKESRRRQPADGTAFADPPEFSHRTTEDRILVQECLAYLKPDDRSLVLESFRLGREELAVKWGIRRDTLRVRLHRALESREDAQLRHRYETDAPLTVTSW